MEEVEIEEEMYFLLSCSSEESGDDDNNKSVEFSQSAIQLASLKVQQESPEIHRKKAR